MFCFCFLFSFSFSVFFFFFKLFCYLNSGKFLKFALQNCAEHIPAALLYPQGFMELDTLSVHWSNTISSITIDLLNESQRASIPAEK